MTDDQVPYLPPKAGKFPTRGMPFDRAALSRVTKKCMDAAHRRGQRIDWEEARTRGFRSLILWHFPSHYKRLGLVSEV